ncbi:MAG: SLC13 family permease [Rickettsiales bacterium]
MTESTHSTATDETNITTRKIGYLFGPLLFVMTLLTLPPVGMGEGAWIVCGLVMWMAVWWMSEAVPLPVTALLPVIIYPLAEILPLKKALVAYANPIIFLFMGGFLIAIAIQKCNLHVRIALNIVRIIGTRPDRMVAGFMTASAFLSMWISNTATMLMMLPIALSTVSLLREKMEKENFVAPKEFAICMLLGIAYASSVGGIGTLIGTPPNAIMSGYMRQAYDFEIGFFEWMKVGIPMVVVMITVMWFVMTRLLFALPRTDGSASRALIQSELAKLGPMSADEKRVTLIASLTALLWMFHPLISKVIPLTFNDTVIAMLGAMLLFTIPMETKTMRCVLTWKDAEKLPWGVLILFGGGLSMAGGFSATGLGDWIGAQFTSASEWPPIVMLVLVLVTITVTTTLMSNVASINVFIPIIVPMAVGLQIHPLFLAIPATMAASCAFMLPVSTANNAIAFGTGHVSIAQMARTGFILNLIALPILVALAYFVLIPVFGIDIGTVPDWALKH